MSADDFWPGDPARRARWEQLMAWLAPRPGERILDVGCGASSSRVGGSSWPTTTTKARPTPGPTGR